MCSSDLGVLRRSVQNAPLDRIRTIDLTTPLLHRLLGVTKVSVGTGVDASRIELGAVTRGEAQRLRTVLLPTERRTPQHTDAVPVVEAPPDDTHATPAAEDVLATLTRLVHDLGLSVLLAEHRLERVIPFADTMCLLTGDGRVRVGEPSELLVDSPVVPPIVELGRAAGWQPLPLNVRDARRRVRGLPDGWGDRVLADLASATAADAAAATPAPVLEATSVTVSHGPLVALREVDLALGPGRVTALMGRNGAGKSTLLWTLQGTRVRRAGRLLADGVDPAGLAPGQRRHHVGLLPQNAADLLYLETVDAELAAGDAGTGAARALLDRLVPGIPGDAHPRDLSEGQRLALALALVLVAEPPVLLLDEPTRGLDYAAKHTLAAVLRDLAAAGHAVLVATHDVEFVAQCADDVVVLAEGEVVSHGPVRRVVAETPAFAPQVTKVLGAPWLRVEEVLDAWATA